MLLIFLKPTYPCLRRGKLFHRRLIALSVFCFGAGFLCLKGVAFSPKESLLAKSFLKTADMAQKNPREKSKTKAKTKAKTKGKVINTFPISAKPISAESLSRKLVGEQKDSLLHFKPALAPWLRNYPSIKTELEKIIQTKKQEIKTDAKELFKENPHSNLLPYRLYIKEIKLFQPKNKDIVSARLKIYIYTGGAHGGSSYYTWNWSKKNQKFLSLDEVLSPAQFTQIVAKTRNLLFEEEKTGGKYDRYVKKDIYRGTSKKKDFKIWNLHQDMMVFVFPEYQVAPYAAGSFEVYVPHP